jgi:sec-independent protein translocase protein TatB
VFDLSLTKILVLLVIALVVFGPNELPKIAAQAGRAMRDLRRIAEGAKADLKEGLGPEFKDFDLDDLNPRRFVQKHLFDDPATTPDVVTRASYADTNGTVPTELAGAAAVGNGIAATTAANGSHAVLGAGDDPPFDFEAT